MSRRRALGAIAIGSRVLSVTETVAAVDELPSALARLGLARSRPVLVSVGGASGLDADVADALLILFRDRLAPLLDRIGAAVVDGGTDAGVMALMGRARREAGARFALLGVAARGTVRVAGEPEGELAGARALLEANHSHRLLVPGDRWGDEIPWMNAIATRLGAGYGRATLVAAGGRVTELDVDASLACGRPTLLLAGSGGTADAIVQAGRRHPLLRVVPRDDGWAGLVATLSGSLVSRGRGS